MGEYVGVKRLDVFIFYMAERYKARTKEETYRIYVTDCLRALTKAKKRWIEYITPPKSFNADQVANDIIERAGLVIT